MHDGNYGESEATVVVYKLSVAIWIFLGLASCASVIATLQDTYLAAVGRVKDKAVQIKEKAGKNTRSTRDAKSRSSVAPVNCDGQKWQNNDQHYSNTGSSVLDRNGVVVFYRFASLIILAMHKVMS